MHDLEAYLQDNIGAWGFGGLHGACCGFDSQRDVYQCYSSPVLYSREMSQSTLCESRRFSPRTPVSSQQRSGQGGLG